MRRVFNAGLVVLNTLLLVTLPTVSYSQSKKIDLNGTWIGKGYSCERGGLSEQVEITVNGNYLIAKKITGDNCVPAGNITFQGTLPDLISAGKSFPVTFTVGNPTNPASSKTVQNLTILDANSFSSYGVKFTRTKGQARAPMNTSLAGNSSVLSTKTKPTIKSITSIISQPNQQILTLFYHSRRSIIKDEP